MVVNNSQSTVTHRDARPFQTHNGINNDYVKFRRELMLLTESKCRLTPSGLQGRLKFSSYRLACLQWTAYLCMYLDGTAVFRQRE